MGLLNSKDPISTMKKLNKEAIKTILSLDLTEIKESIGDQGNLPDIFDLYSELINEGNIDDVIERAHILYSFCTVLGAEFEDLSEAIIVDLEAWYAKQWHKYKSSAKRKYTDSDAKNKIISKHHYIEMKKKASLCKKLSKQLIFGGGKALEMKLYSLNSMVKREQKFEKEGFVGVESEDVAKKIKTRLKRRK